VTEIDKECQRKLKKNKNIPQKMVFDNNIKDPEL
jgi:hypothetical protein